MSDIYIREPTDGGDAGVWAEYELAQNRLAKGVLSCKLYDDSGTLKLTVGQIGFDNGSGNGIVLVRNINTIDISGITNSRWFTVEMTRTGSTPSFTAVELATDTNPAVFPTNVDSYYDNEKGGYYRISTARIIGLGYVDSSGGINGIVNMLSVTEGYRGFVYNNDVAHNITYYYNRDYGDDIGMIEAGTNSSGAWQKYKDGVIRQWMEVTKTGVAQTVAYGGMFRTTAYNETFPISFSSAPVISICANSVTSGNGQTIASTSPATTTQSGSYIIFNNASNASIDIKVYICAVGT